MLISVVVGTYNRRDTLLAMLDSVRDQLPPTVAAEYIVVDNGSTDGTEDAARAWGATVHQLGAPKGAVTAFTYGARRATGRYVLLATDDITFPANGGILRAVRHLETQAACGAVTFAHNKGCSDCRTADNQLAGYRTAFHSVRTPDGQDTMHRYPQIALVRRWLGEAVGWWGGDHPVMSGAFTYAGDNFLGAGIVERGYRVDEVVGVVENERVFQDAGRAMNAERHRGDAALFRQVYPNRPVMRSQPVESNPDAERLRVLLLNDFDPRFPHHKRNKRGRADSWARVSWAWEVDWKAAGANGVAEALRVWQPHLVVAQLHAPHSDVAAALPQLRQLAPDAVWANWIGDVWEKNVFDDAGDVWPVWRHLDVLLHVNSDVVDRANALGVFAAWHGNSYEPVEPTHGAPAHDVVFLGNNAAYRPQMLAALTALREGGLDVGVYGHGWPDGFAQGNTHYDYAAGRGLYQQAAVAISDNAFGASGYASNRFFEITASGGALCLHQQTDRFADVTRMRDGTHYIAWADADDLVAQVRHWVDDAQATRRRQMARNARRVCAKHHSFDARAAQLLTEILPALAAAEVTA